MAELILLPMEHYFDRYRKAYSDLNMVGGALLGCEEQLKFLKGQMKMAEEELRTAERALRSAVVSWQPQGAESDIPEPVVNALKAVESLQPQPDDKEKK